MTLKRVLLGLLILNLVLVIGCSTTVLDENDKNKSENLSLTIGLMPAVDSAPMFLAEEKGYFKELGLDLKIEVFNNGQERQSALQTNNIDGAMTDFIAVATNVNGGFDIKATTMTSGKFPILVKKNFVEKEDIKVGMMQVSVSNFLIDEWLGDKYNIEKVFINEIPARLEMINTGNLDMGLFPEPLASMGELGGLEKRIYEPKDGFSPDVMVFTGKALAEKEEAIRLFHQGYNMAIGDINKDETEARDILIEKLGLNPDIKDMIDLPLYIKASLPDKVYLEKIISWVEEVLGKDIEIKPEDMIEGKFVKDASN